jgi:circadian clock protein KaiC
MKQTLPTHRSAEAERVSTGSVGLDDILGGGLDAERVYLIEGRPGTGKTTLALQFLLEGVRLGERCLYVTLSESERELRAVVARHGWTLEGIDIFELVPPEASLDPDQELTLFHPAEMELSETTKHILDRVAEVNPSRVVFDSLSEMRLLAQNSLRYRRQILALKHFFAHRQCTVVLLDDLTSHQDDLQLHSISHGVITLEQLPLEYGAERRRLRVVKMRGIKFRGGYHDFTIETGRLAIYPRLVAAEHHKSFIGELTSTGSPELDALLGGGIERGTSLLLVGGAGVGKSSVAMTYAMAAAARGEAVTVFAFDEGLGTTFARAAALGMPLQGHVDTGQVRLQQIDPAEMSPGEFAHRVRESVEHEGVRVVVIDSLNGYMNAMPEERFLVLQMHELLSALNQLGVVTILVLAQHGLM